MDIIFYAYTVYSSQRFLILQIVIHEKWGVFRHYFFNFGGGGTNLLLCDYPYVTRMTQILDLWGVFHRSLRL